MKAGTFYDVVLGAVLMVLILIGNRLFASLFSNDESLISTTSRFLVLLCWHVPIIGILNIVSSYFQALGKAGVSPFLIGQFLFNIGLSPFNIFPFNVSVPVKQGLSLFLINWGQTLFLVNFPACELSCVRDWSTAEGVPKRSEGMKR